MNETKILERATEIAVGGDLKRAKAMISPIVDSPDELLRRVASYKLGSVLALLGDLDGADEQFSKHNTRLPWLSGGNMANIRFATPEVEHFPLRRKVLISPATESFDFVYFVACDERYAAMFADAINVSLQRHFPSCLFHLHVINPKGDSRFSAPNPVRSAEAVDLSQLDDVSRRTYYACSRFLLVTELLRRYNRPIIIADADQFVLRSPIELFDMSDIRTITFDSASCNLLSYLSASAVVARPTCQSVDFFEFVRRYINRAFLAPSAVGWHLDQVALTAALLAGPHINFRPLPDQVMHNVARGEAHVSPLATFYSITQSIKDNY